MLELAVSRDTTFRMTQPSGSTNCSGIPYLFLLGHWSPLFNYLFHTSHWYA